MDMKLKTMLVSSLEKVFFDKEPTPIPGRPKLSMLKADTAAYQVIVEEAGGIMRQLDPERSEFTYNRPDSLNANGFFVLNSIENNIIDDDFVIDVRK